MSNEPLFPATITRCIVIDTLKNEMWVTPKGKFHWEKPGWAKTAWLLKEQDKQDRLRVRYADRLKKFDDQSRFVVYRATYTLVTAEKV